MILILASQAGDEAGLGLEDDRIQEFGNETVKRLLALRVSRAAGEASPGEERLDEAIQKASEGDSPLGERARQVEAQVEVQRAKAEADLREELAAAREAVSAAVAARQAAPPGLDPIKLEALDVEVARTKRENANLEARLKHLLGAKR